MLIPFIIPFLIALFLAMTMGGSGTAPAFSAAYGANIIKKNLIPGLFGVFVFLGAILAGKDTAETVGKGIMQPDLMSFTIVSIILFSVAVSLLVANIFGIPQSTSQSAILAIAAPALYLDTLDTDKIFFEIIPAWGIMPIVSFLLAFLAGRYIYKPLRKRGYTISKQVNDNYFLKTLIVIMSCFVAFSIGSNNVANAVGPIATMASNELNVSSKYFVHILILSTFIIAPSFGIGSSLFGNKILQKTGKEIVLFGRIEAVIIAFISGLLLLSASLCGGIPSSEVQINVAAIIGIGVAKLGFKNIFKKTEVNKFFIMWIISPIIAFCISLGLTYFLDNLGYLY